MPRPAALSANEIEAVVGRLASSQHGLVTAAQLGQEGMSPAAIRRRVANGRLVRTAPGVFRMAGAPVTRESRVLAHVLAAGGRAVASHRSAAALWQLDGCRKGMPEISVLRGCWYRDEGARVHQSKDLQRVRPIRRAGIPTTPIERTILDLAAVATHEVVELGLDDARRRQLTDWDRMLTCLVAHSRRGRTGVGTLRIVLDAHHDEIAATDSGFERLVCIRLVEAGLPGPSLQHEVTVEGRAYRLDLAYPNARLAIELDGTVHLRRQVWERDHARQNALILAGWTVLRFTWRDYVERQSALIKAVRTALRAARAS